jgi:pimeloyl-ACP methyl ester carboxylesterase
MLALVYQAMFSSSYAVRYPGHVEHLVLVSPAGVGHPPPPKPQTMAVRIFRGLWNLKLTPMVKYSQHHHTTDVLSNCLPLSLVHAECRALRRSIWSVLYPLYREVSCRNHARNQRHATRNAATTPPGRLLVPQLGSESVRRSGDAHAFAPGACRSSGHAYRSLDTSKPLLSRGLGRLRKETIVRVAHSHDHQDPDHVHVSGLISTVVILIHLLTTN